MTGEDGAIDLVCDAASTLDPVTLTGFRGVVGPVTAGIRSDLPQGDGRRAEGLAGAPTHDLQVWKRRDWSPTPGWDPVAAAFSALPPDWTGLVSYRPVSADALAEWILAPLAAALVRAGRPLLLRWPYPEPLPVDRLFLLARSHPDLGVVVASSYDQAPELLGVLAAAVPRLLVTTGGLAEPTLRALGEAIGWRRIVLGSGEADPLGELARVDGLLGGSEHRDAVRRATARGLLQGRAA